MKSTIKAGLMLAVLLPAFAVTKTRAQSADKPYHQKDMVADNPTADADIKTVSNYTNWIVAGEIDKANSLLAGNFKGYGPGPADSANMEQATKQWQENYKMQSDRKVGFVAQTFYVKSGNLSGKWVSTWGEYTFTESGKTITLPYMCSYHITNGKIDMTRIYYDRLAIVTSLGYTLTAPAGSK